MFVLVINYKKVREFKEQQYAKSVIKTGPEAQVI